MPLVTYIDFEGNAFEAEVAVGQTAMEGAVNKGIDGIIAECGGSCVCATCHVIVDDAWVEKTGEASEDGTPAKNPRVTENQEEPLDLTTTTNHDPADADISAENVVDTHAVPSNDVATARAPEESFNIQVQNSLPVSNPEQGGTVLYEAIAQDNGSINQVVDNDPAQAFEVANGPHYSDEDPDQLLQEQAHDPVNLTQDLEAEGAEAEGRQVALEVVEGIEEAAADA